MFAGIVLFQEGWQSAHGDLTFDPVKFPNASHMISEIRSKGFDVGGWLLQSVNAWFLFVIVHPSRDLASFVFVYMYYDIR